MCDGCGREAVRIARQVGGDRSQTDTEDEPVLPLMPAVLQTCVATNFDKIMRIVMVQNGLLLVFILVGGGFFYDALSTLFPRRHADADETEKLLSFAGIAARPNAGDHIRHINAVPRERMFEDPPGRFIKSRKSRPANTWPTAARGGQCSPKWVCLCCWNSAW